MIAGASAPARPRDDRLTATDELVDLGKLVRRHGVRGEIRLLPFNPDSPALHEAEEIALRAGTSAARWFRVDGRRRHKNFILVWLEGVDTAEKADELVGLNVALRRDQLPVLGDGEIYHCDLIGRAVATEAGERLGVVREILPTGSNDVLVVRGGDHEYLIPWIDDVVVESVPEIVIRPLPGLLDP